MDADREEKRAKFLEDQKLVRKKRNKKIFTFTAIFLVTGVALIAYLNRPYENPGGGNYNIGQTENYKNKKIEMSTVPLEVKDSKAYISLSTLKKDKIIYTEYRGEKKKYYGSFDFLPINAFITPAGRVVVATSICEPCYGTKFYIEDYDLICVACGTHWRLDDLMGLFGGCTKFAPEEFKYTVENDKIVINESVLRNWRPRFYTDEMQSS